MVAGKKERVQDLYLFHQKTLCTICTQRQLEQITDRTWALETKKPLGRHFRTAVIVRRTEFLFEYRIQILVFQGQAKWFAQRDLQAGAEIDAHALLRKAGFAPLAENHGRPIGYIRSDECGTDEQIFQISGQVQQAYLALLL